MKRLATVIAGIGIGLASLAYAQEMPPPEGDRPAEGDRPPRMERPPRGERGAADMTPLTAAQQAQVKAILAKYDPKTLTAEQAKAIHAAFRQAGLRAGPAMGDAIKAAGFDPDRLRELAPPPGRTRGDGGERPPPEGVRSGGGAQTPPDEMEPGARSSRDGETGKAGRVGAGKYSLDQAISDRAQLSTIAFSGLAFLTGDFGACTFLPPGKVCDFFGFQYMRDIDAAGKGHNPVFLNRVAGNVLHILNDTQRKLFEDLAAEQAPQFEQLAIKRMPLIQAFHRQRDGKIRSGSAGLNREAVIRYVGELFASDAELGYRRAEVFGQVAASLTADQKAHLGKMKFGDFNSWPAMDERDKLKRSNPGSSRFFNVAYMTYASEFFSWYAGSVEADTYFCPERHGTYFGGFYMKDMPAMGKRDYDISTSVTGDSGQSFLGLLSAAQRANITSITDNQRKALAEMIEVRRAISVELRKLLSGGQADRGEVLALGRRYGEQDGEVSFLYVMAFAKVNQTLTAEQRAAMIKLRDLDGYTSAPAYLYSQPMQKLPEIADADRFFFPPR